MKFETPIFLVLACVANTAWAQTAPAQPSGADDADELEVPAQPAGAPAPAAPAASPQSKHDGARDLERRYWELTARFEALEASVAAKADAAKAPTPPAQQATQVASSGPSLAVGVRAGETGTETLGGLWTPGLLVSGFVQSQYERSQISEDQVQQGGDYLNEDQFSIRRGRLRLDRRWAYGSGALELDGSTTRGVFIGIRRAEATLLLPSEQGGGGRPLVALTVGLSEVPFGRELTEPTRTRLFMERSLLSLALFPNEPDLGARVAGAVSYFRYAVAAVNGEPIADLPTHPFRGDPNAAKDIVARFGVDTDRNGSPFRFASGVSVLHGKGFHRGRDATKSDVQWRDFNENGAIDSAELVPLPGSAATPSQNFRRWAIGLDLDVSTRSAFGLTRLFGEIVAASNLDRGLFEANPVVTGVNVRHFGWHVGLFHVTNRYGFYGFRVDAYNPNADLFDSRAGKLLPTNQTITTFSPLVGVAIGDRLRVSAQYDFVDDNLARDDRGVPANLKNNRLTFRLQADL